MHSAISVDLSSVCSFNKGTCDVSGLLSAPTDSTLKKPQFRLDKVFVGRIIIKSPDTDVLVLCVHYFSKLQHTQELWFQTGPS
jgi:hypothetical protein